MAFVSASGRFLALDPRPKATTGVVVAAGERRASFRRHLSVRRWRILAATGTLGTALRIQGEPDSDYGKKRALSLIVQ